MDDSKKIGTKPSEEKIWQKFYAPEFQKQLDEGLPAVTLWGLIEPAMRADNDEHDAFVYFGRHQSRSRFIAEVYRWARMLKGMGLGEGDEVLIFCPMTPESVYTLLAIDIIGATAILPNLAASHKALEDSISRAKVAFVFDAIEEPIADILANPQFEHVVILTAHRSMPAPIKQIVGCLNWFKTSNVRNRDEKYISVCQAMKRYGKYEGVVESPYDPERVKMVFSSGGTTKKGTAKQICMTDKAMVNMFNCALAFNLKHNPFRAGNISLAQLPPFVCTGFFVEVLAPLFRGMTIVMEPRLNQETFNKHILKDRPSMTLIPGGTWAGFFRMVESEMAKGKTFDFSHFVLPLMGGEGCTPETLEWMDSILHKCNSPVGIVSGYGMSEAFSVITVDSRPEVIVKPHDRYAICVGYPFPGFTVGIFDEDGNELPYNQRGELRCKTPTITKGYLNNPELTEKTIVDGWIRTGDLAEMDEDGLVYVYGRMYEHVEAKNGEKVYLFDISNRIRQDKAVKESLVTMVGNFSNPRIVAHLILQPDCKESYAEVLQRIDNDLRAWLPEGVEVLGYQKHKGPFRLSIVSKIDKYFYSNILEGYRKPKGGDLELVNFTER